MDNIFTLACCGKSSYAMAWELELGDPDVRQKLIDGDPVIFKLEDGTQMCLRMVESMLLAESVSPNGERSMDWYCQDQFIAEDGTALTDKEFLKQIFLRARRKKLDDLLGAFVE